MDTSNWKWYKIEELFHPQKCKCSNATELLTEGDEIAYIGAKKRDNGIMGFVLRDERYVTKGNCVVFIGDGQGSVGYATYQPVDFIGSTTLLAGYNENLNKYNAQFIVGIIDCERYRYSFGRKFNKGALQKSKILLPALDEENPDWQFMEDFVKNTIIPNLPQKAKEVWTNTYDITPLSSEKIGLSTNEWKLFNLNSIFDISYGNKLDRCQMEEVSEGISFVTRTATNNGVGAYVERLSNIEPYPAHCLSIALGGSIGSTFLQTRPFYTSQNVAVLQPKSNLSDGVLLMIAALIEKECHIKFVAFGRELNKHIKNNIYIKLPAMKLPDGTFTPDWQFMEDYIKSLPYSKNI